MHVAGNSFWVTPRENARDFRADCSRLGIFTTEAVGTFWKVPGRSYQWMVPDSYEVGSPSLYSYDLTIGDLTQLRGKALSVAEVPGFVRAWQFGEIDVPLEVTSIDFGASWQGGKVATLQIDRREDDSRLSLLAHKPSKGRGRCFVYGMVGGGKRTSMIAYFMSRQGKASG